MGHFARALSLAVVALPLLARAQSSFPQIEQARQFAPPSSTLPRETGGGLSDFPDGLTEASPDDAFGAQVLLKEKQKIQPFSAFTEVAAFFTNNVALVDRARDEDKFLVISAGGTFTRQLAPQLRLDLGARGSVYRYSEFRELDFQSTDLIAGLTYTPPVLRGAEVLLRYTFTDLTTAERIREFYKNHAVLVGIQHAYPLARAHAVYGGLTAQWSWADPRETGRDEYVAFAGYRAQLTRSIDADLIYRYGRYVYRESGNREDDNQTVSLTFRYVPKPWIALSATAFYTVNRSSEEVFDYEVLNAGLSLQFLARF